MEIQITEHKSVGTLNSLNTSVRVFVGRDFHYGYFVPEHQMFDLLTEDQKQDYLQGTTVRLDVPAAIAQQLIDMSQTPYKKRSVVQRMGEDDHTLPTSEADARDAARYRWLRDIAGGGGLGDVWIPGPRQAGCRY